MDIVVRRESLRDAPNREHKDKSILLGVTHADPQAQVHLRGGSADHDGSAAPTPRRASVSTTLVRDMCPSTNGATNLPF